jgi:UDP-N-acetylmuramate: L-alanyl-gamma-D-glutamyl-meso-diaminopimelate ligase
MRSARNDKHSMKLHILGIAGTFMGGVAALARELGHAVEGSDQNIYPPMSTQLEQLGIALKQGYSPANISGDCDEIVVGNALSRGNEAVEHVLDAGLRYTSGAQWLSEQVLPGSRRAGGRRHPRQDHDDDHPVLPAGSQPVVRRAS